MRGVSAREKKMVLFGLLAAAASAGFRFAGVPFVEKNAALDKRIGFLRAQLDEAASLVSGKETIEARFRELFASGSDGRPQDGSILSALTEIESLARKAGLTVEDIRPQAQTEGAAFYREELVGVRTRGDLGGYAAFLYSLGRSESLFRVRRLELVYRPAEKSIDAALTISRIIIQ